MCVANRRRQDTALTPEERRKISAEIDAHIKQVMQEKDLYYDNRERSRTEPRKYLSLIIDGADMKNHELPHFAEICKLSSEAKRLKLHLYGALAHGHCAHFTTCLDHEAQGNNVTIQLIWEVINRIYNEKKYLPSVLLLQLDNTTKQNKGRYLFGFLGMLVANGLFKKVLLAFLPVGHTHEDIDQAFSRLSIHLRMNNAFTREDMGEAVKRSYTFEGKTPSVYHWDTIANVRDFLEEYLVKEEEKVSSTAGLVNYRHFRFSMINGTPVVQCRPKMVEEDDNSEIGWTGMVQDTNHTYLFPSEKGVPDLLEAFREGILPAAINRKSPDHENLTTMKTKLFPALQLLFPYVHLFCKHLIGLFLTHFFMIGSSMWTMSPV
tara:strand:+ start:229 stop:1359 length:1131 start_codon:yes stop_codon:yes gene_type:complete